MSCSAGDVWVALEHEDFAAAERHGLEFGEDRLLVDLGWESKDTLDGANVIEEHPYDEGPLP